MCQAIVPRIPICARRPRPGTDRQRLWGTSRLQWPSMPRAKSRRPPRNPRPPGRNCVPCDQICAVMDPARQAPRAARARLVRSRPDCDARASRPAPAMRPSRQMDRIARQATRQVPHHALGLFQRNSMLYIDLRQFTPLPRIGFENRQGSLPRGFESSRLRHPSKVRATTCPYVSWRSGKLRGKSRCCI